MAISTDDRIVKFGSRTQLDSSAASISAGSYVEADTTPTWSNSDDAEKAVLDIAIAFTTAPTAKGLVKVYMQRLNFNGTNDEENPSDDVQGAYVGSFEVDNIGSSTTQYFVLEIDLVGVKTNQEYSLWLYNGTDQSINSGWNAYITPIAPGPHA